MFGSFGTPSNFAVRPYLNENNIPQLFVASGDQEWNRPKEQSPGRQHLAHLGRCIAWEMSQRCT